jgi:hypothetical protein
MFPYMWFCSPAGAGFLALASWNNRTPVDCRALIDSGADQSYLPARIAKALGLVPKNNNIRMYGAGGSGGRGSLYAVNIELRHANTTVFNFPNLLVVSDDHFPLVLIGRDIINEYIVTLDGPSRRFSMAQQ